MKALPADPEGRHDRALLREVPVDNPGIHQDVDSPEDLAHLA